VSHRNREGELKEVTVKAYIVCSDDYRWIKPYLFHSEATEIAELMTVVGGKYHWLTEIEMERLPNALVRFGDRELIVDLCNINAVGEEFEADAIIEGHLYRVRHRFPFEPWEVVPTLNMAVGFHEDSEITGARNDPSTKIIHPTTKAHKPVEDETACWGSSSGPKQALS
jgi:hypothetical protein